MYNYYTTVWIFGTFSATFSLCCSASNFQAFYKHIFILSPDPFSLPFFLLLLFLLLLVMQLDLSILCFSLTIRIIISKVDKYQSNCRLFQHKLWWPFRSLESIIGMVASSSACSHWMFVCLFSGAFFFKNIILSWKAIVWVYNQRWRCHLAPTTYVTWL